MRSVATFLSVLQSFPLSEHLPSLSLSLVTVQTLRQSEGGIIILYIAGCWILLLLIIYEILQSTIIN